MRYCSNCGNQLREGARFCDKCGYRMDEVSYSSLEDNFTGEAHRSVRLFVSQQRLIIALLFVGLGIIFLILALQSGMSSSFGLSIGMVFIGIGLAVLILGKIMEEKY